MIANFSSHANQTEVIKSSKFEIVGPNGDKNKWFMEMYPNGLNGTKEYAGLYVKLAEAEKIKVLAKIELAIMDWDGVEKCKTETTTCGERIWLILTPTSRLGCSNFVKRDLLLNEENGLLANGKLTIVCHIEIEQAESPATNIQIPSCQLSADFGNLLEGGILADFVLISSDNKEYKVHKIVLACRSPVFAEMFQQTKAQNNHVKIQGIRGDVVHKMLHFIYTGEAPNIGAMAKELLTAADKYQIETLKVLCERSLALSLNIGNAAELLVLADLHSADHLKSEVVQFIASHAGEVIKSDGWQILSKGCHLLAQLFEAMASRKGNL